MYNLKGGETHDEQAIKEALSRFFMVYGENVRALLLQDDESGFLFQGLVLYLVPHWDLTLMHLKHLSIGGVLESMYIGNDVLLALLMCCGSSLESFIDNQPFGLTLAVRPCDWQINLLHEVCKA
jgi:hypothetical protein